MKNLFYSVLMVMLGCAPSLAQVLTNDGAAIFSDFGALIFVDGEMVNQNNGTYDNSGTIELSGDWTNNAGNYAFINGSPGNVLLSGANQNIKGTAPTLFYDLYLTGTGTKTQEVNAWVSDSLALNDRELATDTFIMHVTNTNINAISRQSILTGGFVSSLDTGGLKRNMANMASYLFPVGSNIGVQRYRPVEISPNSVSAHTYKVRMANIDATSEGFDRLVNDSTFCVINPDYYHRINRTFGLSSSDISIYFDDNLDNNYQTIAHWQNTPRWEDITPVNVTNNVSPILSFITKPAWNDFTLPAFALGTTSPLVTLSVNDTSICEGDTLNFSASSGFLNYEFFSNSVSIQNGPLNTYQIVGLTSGDTIKVIASDLSCTAYSNELIITVNPNPIIDTLGINIAAANCGNSDGAITGIIVSGFSPFTYQWVDGNSTIVGGDSANVMNIPAENYTLTVTDTNSCSSSSIHIVPGAPGPVLDSSAFTIDSSTCGNNNGSISGITISGGTIPFAFDWQNGTLNSVGASIDLTNIVADSYILTVTDSYGCTASTGPYIVSDIPGPVLDTSGLSLIMSTCGNSDGNISNINVSSGSVPLTFDWVNSIPTSVGNSIDLLLIPAGSYTLTVTDSNGCTASTGPHLINDTGAPTISTSGLTIDSSRCDTGTGLISGITVSGGTGTLTYLWDDPASQSDSTATGLAAGSYTLTVIDSAGCIASSGPHTVPNFTLPPTPNVITPPLYCTGDTASDLVVIGISVTSLTWYSNSLLTDSIGTGSPFSSNATTDTSYWVTDTRNGCEGLASQVDIIFSPTPSAPLVGTDTSYCFGGNIFNDLIATGTGGIEWWADQGLTVLLGTGNTLPISPGLGTTIYYATDTNGLCQSPYDSVIVTVDPQVSASITGNTNICDGDSTTLIATGGGTYLWNTTDIGATITVSPSVITTYSCIITNGACTGSASVSISVGSPPIANITGNSNLCYGETVTLIADNSDSYLWLPSGEMTQSITILLNTGINDYSLVVTNSCGSDTATTQITVQAPVSAGPNTSLCHNFPAGYLDTLSATPVGGTWTSSDPLVSPNLNPDGFIDHISIPWGNNYEIIYTAGGCSDTLLLDVIGSDAGEDTIVCPANDYFNLPNAFPNGGIWTAPFNTAANFNINPDETVDKEGIKGEIIFVYNNMGCPDTVLVDLCGENDVWVANIFSPNGDNSNDLLFVRGEAIDWVHLKIYDRWGELVFDSGNGLEAMTSGWDGTAKGKAVSPQVFAYYLEGAFLDGKEIFLKGNITLVK